MPDILTPSQLPISFTGSTPVTRNASLSGARAAIRSASSQAARMLVLYLDRGASTDGEIATLMGLPEGRISARRSALIKKDLVHYVDTMDGPYGAKVTRWDLSVRGVHVAGKLRSEQTSCR